MAQSKPTWSFIAACFLVETACCHGAEAQVVPPWNQPAASLGVAEDRVIVQLTAPASRAAYVPAGVGSVVRTRLGLPAMDRLLASWPGAWLEPEFRGDAPPAPGSSATDFSAFYVVHLPAGAARDDALRRFRGLTDVANAHPIGLAPATAVPNDSLWSLAYYFYQPSRRDIHAPEAWDLTRGDTSIVVAIIDTGVLPYHPDLGGTIAGSSGQFWTNWTEACGLPGVDDDGNGFLDDFHGWDFVNLINDVDAVPGEDWQDADNDPNDYIGHGTCVAGLVGAINDNQIGVTGTAWNVRLMPLRVVWSSPRQQTGIVDMSYVAAAVRYATRMHANVINLSLANKPDYELGRAVQAALDSNIVVVVAAGNNGTPNYIGDTFPDLIVVAATDADDVVPIWSNRNSHVDLSAPGVNLATTILSRPGTDSLGLRTPSYVPDVAGTSFCAPIVSGAAALVDAVRKARGIEPLSPRQMGTLLQYTSDDMSSQNPGLTGYGAGRLNMARAILAGSRVRAKRLKSRVLTPGISFRTNQGDSLLAVATEDAQLVFLDAITLDVVRSVSLGVVAASALAASDLGIGRAMGIFFSLGDRMAGFGGGGAPLPGWPVTVPSGGLVGMPVLGDLDGDGSLEIVSAGTGAHIWAWTSAGSLYPGFPLNLDPGASVYAPLALSDLDGQPGVEIIAAQTNGRIHAYRWNGAEPNGWPVSTDDALPAGPVVADLAGEPVVVVSGSSALHRIVSGVALPEISQINVEVTADPALGDLDHDGTDDIVVAASSGLQVTSLGGATLPGWPLLWNSPLVGAPLTGNFAATDTQAIILPLGSLLRAFSGSGQALPDFVPYPDGDPYASLLATGSGDSVRLIQGSASDSTMYGYDFRSGAKSTTPHAWPAFRGNFARTGSRSYQPGIGVGDAIPPRAVADLRVAGVPDSSSNVLAWSAPLDEGPAGEALEYDVRAALTARALEVAFTAAKRLPVNLAPSAADRPDSLLLSGLDTSDRYFAIRSRDASGNWSAASPPVARQFPGPLEQRPGLAIAVGRNPSGLPLAIAWQASGSAAARRVIRILDIGGRVIRTIALGSGSQGTLNWDGRNSQGSITSSGVYLAILIAGPDRTTTRFVLLR